MNREELLKNLIISQYGSVLKFSKEAGIPESSLRNIFTRGLDSISAGMLVKICQSLNVDIEHLMSGALSVRPNPQVDAALEQFRSSSLTPRDEKDIAAKLERLMAQLEDAGDLMFDGNPMSDEARESIKSAMKLGLEAAKLKNKARFTPKKYRKEP